MTGQITPTDLRTEDPRHPSERASLEAAARRTVLGRLGDGGADVLAMLRIGVSS